MGLTWFKDKAVAAVRAEVGKRMDRAGAAVVGRAQQLCPVDSGRLRASIGYTYNASTLTLTIHADQYYASFVEFGTSRNYAQPFLRPALAELPAMLSMVTNVGLQFSGTPTRYVAGMGYDRGHGPHPNGARASFGHGRFT